MTPDRQARAVPSMALPQNVETPVLGLGTWQLTGSACERVVEQALHLGYRHIDTAEAYGNEEAIGNALASSSLRRNELFITSKVAREHLREREVQHACRQSLDRLGTGYLDLYLVHWPNRAIPMAETLRALEDLREEGVIRAWGVSNFTAAHLREALEVGRPGTNQVELHPYFQQPDLRAACGELGVPLSAYRPLDQGRVAEDPILTEVGRRHEKTAAQVALRWLVQRGCLVLPKASAPERLRENLELFDFELTEEEMARISSLDQGRRMLEPSWAEFDRVDRGGHG